jgi:NADH-quinone oxidoreductase subunit A
MPALVGYLLLFVGLAVFFVFIHLVMGRLVRPMRPSAEKLTIYECGEPTIGSSWIQFDLRFYVVALLFVIFDVEVAFFFPWAVVFGQANNIAAQAEELKRQGTPSEAEQQKFAESVREIAPGFQLETAGAADPAEARKAKIASTGRAAHEFAWFAFWDIIVFFGVLLVGFAYLWKRGDINWVRSTAAEDSAETPLPEAPVAPEPLGKVLIGAGHDVLTRTH